MPLWYTASSRLISETTKLKTVWWRWSLGLFVVLLVVVYCERQAETVNGVVSSWRSLCHVTVVMWCADDSTLNVGVVTWRVLWHYSECGSSHVMCVVTVYVYFALRLTSCGAKQTHVETAGKWCGLLSVRVSCVWCFAFVLLIFSNKICF